MKRHTLPRLPDFLRGAAPVLLVAALAALSMNGCGSGSSSPDSATSVAATKKTATGRASFKFAWPKRSATARLIPVDANSIQVNVASGGTVVATQLIARPANGASTATVTFTSLNVGDYTVAATAFPNADGSGVAQATAQTTATITANQATQFSLTMASTIASLSISPTITGLTVGQSVSLIATPMDAQGNIVLIAPGTLQWTSSATGMATVDTSGKVSGIAAGPVTITATETESGKTASVVLTVVAPAPPPVTSQAVAYQINPSHTGSVAFGQPLTFPASPTWSVNAGGQVSYPLIAGGKIFITTGKSFGNYGAFLSALDEATGKTVWGPIAIGGAPYVPSNWAGLAYDNGKIFTVADDGTVCSFDASSGSPGWRMQISTAQAPQGFNSSPTAANGILYFSGDVVSKLYAVSETNGSVLWTTNVEYGGFSSPTVSFDSAGASSGVFVAYPCKVYKLDPNTGSVDWNYNGPCDGGGGSTAVFSNGELYVTDVIRGGVIYDASSGNQTGTFDQPGQNFAQPIPAIGATTEYILNTGVVSAISLASRQTNWTFKGDGNLDSAPLLIDQTVIVGSSSGTVYALNAVTGARIWSGSAGASIPDANASEQSSSQPLTGFAAGEGYLVVPAGSTITAWKIAGP